MNPPTLRFFAWPALCALLACCGPSGSDAPDGAPTSSTAAEADVCPPTGAAAVAERLGARLADVPLLAPDSILTRALREAYAPLVTSALLDEWIANPSEAPGRDVSSPWPERIAVDSLEQVGPDACRLHAEVVLVASVEGSSTPAEVAREPVTLLMRYDGGWRVAQWREPEPTPAAAADVVRAYYADLAAGRYRSAFERWSGDGAASGQSFEDFEAEHADVETVIAEVGAPGRVEGAAGSRYVDVPVTVRTTTADGETRLYRGSYALRRAVVDGATAAQRRWSIHSADLEPLDDGPS